MKGGKHKRKGVCALQCYWGIFTFWFSGVKWGVFALFWSLIDVTEHILGILFVFFSTINFFMIVLLNVHEWLNEWDHAKLQQWM